MKKFLLLALTAAVAVTASAQAPRKMSQTEVKAVSAQKQSALSVKKAPEAKALNFSQLNVVPGVKPVVKTMAPSMLKGLTAEKNFSVSKAPKKAGEVQASYVASGNDYFNKTPIQWTLENVTLKDGEGNEIPGFNNVIPTTGTNLESLGDIAVPYTLTPGANGKTTIKIGPEKVAGSETMDIYLVDLYSAQNDCAIYLTLNEDGSIEVPDGAFIAYSAFDKDQFDPTLGPTFKGSYRIVTDAKYQLADAIGAPNVMYEPDNVVLHAGVGINGYAFTNNLMMVPAFGNLAFKNYTTDPVEEWSWSFDRLKYNAEAEGYDVEETITGSDQNFSTTTVGGSVYSPAVLKGSYNGKESDPYQWGLMGTSENDEGQTVPNYEAAIMYAGHSSSSFAFEDGTEAIITKCNPDFMLAYHSGMATKGINSNNYNITHIVSHQGKPTTPLYITGVCLYARDFQAKDGFNIHCKLIRETGDKYDPTDESIVIAEADLTSVDDVDTRVSNGVTLAQLNWKNFYVVDELGMTQEVPYLLIDEDFAIAIDDWSNGTFEAIPFGEYNYNASGTTNTNFYMNNNFNNYYSWTGDYTHLYFGFLGATYGYLYTEDNTTVSVDAEGGQASIHVKPMFWNNDKTTRLFLDNFNEEEIPEWLTISFANETYDDTVEGFEDYGFDLVLEAAANDTEEERTATIPFMQEGAKLVVTVKQPQKGAGVASVSVAKASNKSFNVLGQRVSKNFRGIVIENGKKIVK